jgi:hypothetical protein
MRINAIVVSPVMLPRRAAIIANYGPRDPLPDLHFSGYASALTSF